MAHTCKSLVFRCMDFRIKPTVLTSLLAQAGVNEGDYDTVSLAGGAKDLLGAEGESSMIIKQIELSSKLHCISQVVILQHDGCGAYGIADQAQEDATQRQDLLKIAEAIKGRFPDLQMVAFIIKGVPEDNLRLEAVPLS